MQPDLLLKQLLANLWLFLQQLLQLLRLLGALFLKLNKSVFLVWKRHVLDNVFVANNAHFLRLKDQLIVLVGENGARRMAVDNHAPV